MRRSNVCICTTLIMLIYFWMEFLVASTSTLLFYFIVWFYFYFYNIDIHIWCVYKLKTWTITTHQEAEGTMNCWKKEWWPLCFPSPKSVGESLNFRWADSHVLNIRMVPSIWSCQPQTWITEKTQESNCIFPKKILVFIVFYLQIRPAWGVQKNLPFPNLIKGNFRTVI